MIFPKFSTTRFSIMIMIYDMLNGLCSNSSATFNGTSCFLITSLGLCTLIPEINCPNCRNANRSKACTWRQKGSTMNVIKRYIIITLHILASFTKLFSIQVMSFSQNVSHIIVKVYPSFAIITRSNNELITRPSLGPKNLILECMSKWTWV